jgi:hypothetical protein
MPDLLDRIYEAHGGLERWRQLKQLRFTGSAGGKLPWPRADFLASTGATLDTRSERALIEPFGAPGRRGLYTLGHVEVLGAPGAVLAKRDEPRRRFAGYPPDGLWDDLDAAYFAGYAFWTYLTVTFLLPWDGVRAEEIEPWQENGETWRRLRVTFPDYMVRFPDPAVGHAPPARQHDVRAGPHQPRHPLADPVLKERAREQLEAAQVVCRRARAPHGLRRGRGGRAYRSPARKSDVLLHLALHHSRPEWPGPRHRP